MCVYSCYILCLIAMKNRRIIFSNPCGCHSCQDRRVGALLYLATYNCNAVIGSTSDKKIKLLRPSRCHWACMYYHKSISQGTKHSSSHEKKKKTKFKQAIQNVLRRHSTAKVHQFYKSVGTSSLNSSSQTLLYSRPFLPV